MNLQNNKFFSGFPSTTSHILHTQIGNCTQSNSSRKRNRTAQSLNVRKGSVLFMIQNIYYTLKYSRTTSVSTIHIIVYATRIVNDGRQLRCHCSGERFVQTHSMHGK